MDGFINLNKPIGPTSSQVVVRLKGLTRQKKVGHTGTLDPGASGVLPICLGKATKLANLITDSKKVYTAEITFGITTDTQDRHGKVIKKCRAHLDKQRLKQLLEGFKGPIEQIPPMYSAIKHGGTKLYELARRGLEVERKIRNVEIYRLELKNYSPPNRAIIEIECSKGTYIRTLCHDIGEKSGFGAIMSNLTRTAVGKFCIEDAVTLDKLGKAASQGRWQNYLLPADYPLDHMPKVFVKNDSLKYALNGNLLFYHNLEHCNGGFSHRQQLRIYSGSTLLGIYTYYCDKQPPYLKAERLLVNASTPLNNNNRQ